jgi:exosortase
MSHKNSLFFSCLFLLAIFIWLHDTTWIMTLDDSIPLLLCIPIAVCLGKPWKLKSEERFLSPPFFLLGFSLVALGAGFNSTFLLALGWCYILYSWQKEHLEKSSLEIAKRTFVLCMMAFPWFSRDAATLGWIFRLTGTSVTAAILSFFDLPVIQHGTDIDIQGISIFVAPGCTGINSLQSIFIAGTVLACFIFDSNKLFFFNLPVLVVAAWIANTLRIFITTLLAIVVSPSLVQGIFHYFLGIITLIFMFSLCYLLFSFEKTYREKEQSQYSLSLPRWGWFDLIILLWTVIISSTLVSSWKYNPFDEYGWFIFLFWLVPIFFQQVKVVEEESTKKPLYFYFQIIALALSFLGVLSSIHFLCYEALAFALCSLKRDFSLSPLINLLWLLIAITWMPAFGWALESLTFSLIFFIKLVLVSFVVLLQLSTPLIKNKGTP